MATAVIFDSDVTSFFLQEESSGPMLDARSDKDFESTFGSTLTGTSRILDGINDYERSQSKVSGKIPLTVAADWLIYMHVITPAPSGTGEQKIWFGASESTPTKQGPAILPRSNIQVGQFNMRSHSGGGNAGVILQCGRDFIAGEEVMVVLTYDISAKVVNAHLRSKDGTGFSGLNFAGTATGTIDPDMNNTDKYYIGTSISLSQFANIEVLEWGVVQGKFFTQTEIADELEAWFLSGGTDTTPDASLLLLT